MTIETTRFGTIPLDPERILTFPEGLLGFPGHTRYLLLETGENSLFYWLQSIDDPALAFVVMDPCLLVPDYSSRVQGALSDPDSPGTDPGLMVIVTVPEAGMESMTANLQGPLVVCQADRTGKQCVLFDLDEWLHFPLFADDGQGRTETGNAT